MIDEVLDLAMLFGNSVPSATLAITASLKIAGILAKDAGYNDVGTVLQVLSFAIPIIEVAIVFIEALVWALTIPAVAVV